MATLQTPLPQMVFAEIVGFPGQRGNQVNPQAVVLGTACPGVFSESFTQRFGLQFTTITSADCSSLARFFRQHRGATFAFDFVHPIDGRTYRARFADTMRAELFTPGYFSTNPLEIVTVSS